MMKQPPPNLAGALLALAAFGLYAVNDNIIKFLGSYDAFQIMFFGVAATLPLLLGHMALDRRIGTYRPIMPGWMAIRCAVSLIQTVLVVYAFGNMSLAQAYAIFFAVPLMITLLAAWTLGETIGLARGLAVLIGFGGVVIALQPGRDPLAWVHLVAIVGAIMGALNFVILRKTAQVERAALNILYPSVVQLAAGAIALPFVYTPMPMTHLALTWALAICGYIGSVIIIHAYRTAPAIVVSPMQYSQIIWAALTAAFIFNEDVTLVTWAGLTVIIGSGVYILYSTRRQDAA
jgi:S-adenosylmethionine uptake transporter